jgi:predicted Fe-Mo cluster-binding NifX family protein
MGVSRQTFGRIVESARKKTADALLNGKALKIDGGTVSIASQAPMASVIAVPTTEENTVEEHFGLCTRFAIFSAGSDGKIVSERRFDLRQATGCRSGLIPALAAEGVTHLIVGRVGEGALRVLGSHGMAVFRGATGPVRAAAEAFLRGELDDGGSSFDIDASMGPARGGARRGEGRGRHGHGCGEGGRGCADRGET